MTDALRHNANVIDSLGSALRSGDHALGSVPGLLKQVLLNASWREFITKRDETVKHERFIDFVTTPPLKGLGADMALLRRICADDQETLDALDEVEQRKPGRPPKTVDSINSSRPSGTSNAYALRRLRKDRPDLHARVLAGELSPNAAMVLAGFRAKTLSVKATPEGFAAAADAHFNDAELCDLVVRLWALRHETGQDPVLQSIQRRIEGEQGEQGNLLSTTTT